MWNVIPNLLALKDSMFKSQAESSKAVGNGELLQKMHQLRGVT